ncbi:helix-turn-helix domain-containing protein [Thermodesulfobacteriota bacterium]
MSEKRLSSDAVEWAYNRYIKGNPEREASFAEVSRQSDLAQQIYDIREKLNMTREQLAEFSGLSPETIEDLEETDYEGDWEEAIDKVNRGFHNWFTNVILPAARMKPEDYSVRVAGL